MSETHRVIALVEDMFFASRIRGAAEQSGRLMVRVRSQDELERELAEPADLILIDLNSSRPDPLAAIAFLKSRDETAAIPMVGFLSHVQIDLMRQAESAGCDYVLPRSKFTQLLGQIISGDLSSIASLKSTRMTQ
ncbi:MAG TPA: response regulator [Blastocatellia bacterium]|nr:response regulator [Blastocatellia bacterium]